MHIHPPLLKPLYRNWDPQKGGQNARIVDHRFPDDSKDDDWSLEPEIEPLTSESEIEPHIPEPEIEPHSGLDHDEELPLFLRSPRNN